MKRGFLKGGFDKAPKTTAIPKKEPSDTKSQTRAEHVHLHETLNQSGHVVTHSTTSTKQTHPSAVHPEPLIMELHAADGDSSGRLAPVHAQGMKTITQKGPQRQFVVLGFGGTDEFWDTLCVTYVENRIPLREHSHFRTSYFDELDHLDKDAFRVGPIPGRGGGLGLIARRDIAKGEVFLRERPLLVMVQALPLEVVQGFDQVLSRMLPHRRAAFDKLYNCKPRGPGMNDALSKVRTNSIETSLPFDTTHHGATFDFLSRANHSCTPNATYDWDYSTFRGELMSEVFIPAGTEITITYTNLFRPAAERKTELAEKYFFTCACPACDPSSPTFAASEERRKAIKRLLPTIHDPSTDPANFDNAYIKRVLDLLDKEGLTNRAPALAFFVYDEKSLSDVHGDTRRLVELATWTMDEIKKLGNEGKGSLWSSMKEIVDNATVATAQWKEVQKKLEDPSFLEDIRFEDLRIDAKGMTPDKTTKRWRK